MLQLPHPVIPSSSDRRLFHLIDRTSPPAAAATLLSLVSATPCIEHAVYVNRCQPLLRDLAAGGLRCAAMPRRAPDLGEASLLAWSAGCAVRAAWGWRRPVAWVAMAPATGWRGAALHVARVRVLSFGDDPALPPAATRVEPIFDPRLIAAHDGAGWDRRPGDRIIALLADDPTDADAMAALLAVAIADEAGRDQPGAQPLRLLAHPDARHIARARRLADSGGSPRRLALEPGLCEPWRVLAGCDAALLWGRRIGLAASWAAAAGLPVVAAPHADARRAAQGLLQLDWTRRAPAPPPTDLPGWNRVLPGKPPQTPPNP